MIAHESYSVKSYSVKCSFMACNMLMPILWQHIEGWRNYIFARVRCNCKWYFQRDCNTWDLASWIRNRTLIWRSKTNVFVQWQNCWESADLLGKWDLKSWIWKRTLFSMVTDIFENQQTYLANLVCRVVLCRHGNWQCETQRTILAT